jgi:hypothetical protein
VQTWKLGSDPEFIGKVRDIVGLYLDPPEKALVLAVDEKSQIQALVRTAPCLPVLPTTPARMTMTTYGTAPPACSPPWTWPAVIAQHYRRRRDQEFLRFLKLIDTAVPPGLDLHLICDNYATHCCASFLKNTEHRPRWIWGHWLSLAEIPHRCSR